MIRHEYDEVSLRNLISVEDPKWFSKAKARTTKLVKAGSYSEKSSIWSSAKPAFMLVQKNKCAFCERVFGTADDARRIEMDLEHFRPKNGVQPWSPPDGASGYPRQTGGVSPGYYWLAYNVSNYAASCKTCNTVHKSNAFPVRGPRCTQPGNAAALAAEKPFLCYPLGKADDDPETLITFRGTIAVPVHRSGFKRQRALLTIDFFGLSTHDLLHFERAREIERFGLALTAVAAGEDTASDRTYVSQIGNPMIGHASCVRAFGALWQQNQPDARRILTACRDMLARRLN